MRTVTSWRTGSTSVLEMTDWLTDWQTDLKIQRFKDSKIQRFKDSKIQRFKDLKIWRFEDLKIWRFEGLKIWKIRKFKDLKNWRFEDSKIQRFKESKISNAFCDIWMILHDLLVMPNVGKHLVLTKYAISSQSNNPKSRKSHFWHFGSFKTAFFWNLNDPTWPGSGA